MPDSISPDMLSLGIVGGACILGLVYYTGTSTKKSMEKIHSIQGLLKDETTKFDNEKTELIKSLEKDIFNEKKELDEENKKNKIKKRNDKYFDKNTTTLLNEVKNIDIPDQQKSKIKKLFKANQKLDTTINQTNNEIQDLKKNLEYMYSIVTLEEDINLVDYSQKAKEKIEELNLITKDLKHQQKKNLDEIDQLIKHENLISDEKAIQRSIKHQTKTRGLKIGGKKTKKLTFL